MQAQLRSVESTVSWKADQSAACHTMRSPSADFSIRLSIFSKVPLIFRDVLSAISKKFPSWPAALSCNVVCCNVCSSRQSLMCPRATRQISRQRGSPHSGRASLRSPGSPLLTACVRLRCRYSCNSSRVQRSPAESSGVQRSPAFWVLLQIQSIFADAKQAWHVAKHPPMFTTTQVHRTNLRPDCYLSSGRSFYMPQSSDHLFSPSASACQLASNKCRHIRHVYACWT